MQRVSIPLLCIHRTNVQLSYLRFKKIYILMSIFNSVQQTVYATLVVAIKLKMSSLVNVRSVWLANVN